MHKAKKKTISTYHKKNHTKMSNNASKYSAEDEQTSKVSAPGSLPYVMYWRMDD